MRRLDELFSDIKSRFQPVETQLSPDRSCVFTKAHGLHNLGLCKPCSLIDLDSLSDGEPRVHLANYFDLIQSSETCSLCACITHIAAAAGRISILSERNRQRSIEHGYRLSLFVSLRASRLRFRLAESGDPDVDDMYEDLAAVEVSWSAPHERLSRDISVEVLRGIPPCFSNYISSMSKTCSATNVEKEEMPVLPRRVVDIGEEHESRSARLHISGPGERGYYATLSYRWGSRLPLRTTKRTFKKHKTCLVVQTLPQTFQDAIMVTRYLGLRYLWIDALCIIQDDKRDWSEQAMMMGEIYKHSAATIAVHSATNSSEGFLWRRTVSEFLEIGPVNESPSFWVKLPSLGDHSLEIAMDRSEIARRAWIFQELCLSKHTLHFVEDHLIWDCRHAEHAKFPRCLQFVTDFREKDDWPSFVEAYSDCLITRDTDRLPAIAGLAGAWSKSRDDSRIYYSGVFADQVPRILLWSSRSEENVRLSDVAPTWSWASIKGSICFLPSALREPLAVNPCMTEITFNCECGNLSQNHSACPRCVLQSKTVLVRGNSIEPVLVGFEKGKASRTMTARGPIKYSITLQQHSEVIGWAMFDEIAVPSKVEDLWYMQVASPAGKEGKAYYVLILKSLSRRAAKFRRVGVGSITQPTVFGSTSPRQVLLV